MTSITVVNQLWEERSSSIQQGSNDKKLHPFSPTFSIMNAYLQKPSLRNKYLWLEALNFVQIQPTMETERQTKAHEPKWTHVRKHKRKQPTSHEHGSIPSPPELNETTSGCIWESTTAHRSIANCGILSTSSTPEECNSFVLSAPLISKAAQPSAAPPVSYPCSCLGGSHVGVRFRGAFGRRLRRHAHRRCFTEDDR